MKRIYLDYAATTPVKREVVDAMLPYLSATQNYSDVIETCKIKFEKQIGAEPGTLSFNSGGSYGNNEAIRGFAYLNRGKGKHIITSKIEHPSVTKVFEQLAKEGFEVTFINVDSKGKIDMVDFKSHLRPDTILVSVMMVNNELGTHQPIEEISTLCKENGTLFHVDGVQALGNVQIDVKRLGMDAMTFSAHKVYAPKGCGALYLRRGLTIESLVSRCESVDLDHSTNTAYIVGFMKGIELAYAHFEENVSTRRALKAKLINGIEQLQLGIKVNGPCDTETTKDTLNHPGIVNLYFPQMDGDSLVINFDFNGFAISSGSACSSGALSASHVLKAIGLSETDAKKCIRITVGDFTTEEDIIAVLAAISRILKGTHHAG